MAVAMKPDTPYCPCFTQFVHSKKGGFLPSYSHPDAKKRVDIAF
jgi:hypothetical protein